MRKDQGVYEESLQVSLRAGVARRAHELLGENHLLIVPR